RRKRAAPVEVSEKRLPFTIAFADAIEVGIERVGQLTRTDARSQGIGGAIQHRPVLADEVLPGAFVTNRASACERQIVEMETTEISAEICWSRPVGAGLECLREPFQRDGPLLCVRVAVESACEI